MVNTAYLPCLQGCDDIDPGLLQAIMGHRSRDKGRTLTPEQAAAKRRRIWLHIAKKEIPKVCTS